MSRQELNLLEIPLRGTNLIEANAGTGKTYNITGLFTRMVAELGFGVESILVVTFTNAAVSDLKSKIYSRLSTVLEAMQALKDGAEYISGDPFPAAYAQMRRGKLDESIAAVRYALRDFDQCSIFTIHGFCHRMLKESAFSGKIPYDVELTGNSRELLKRPVYDFWRKNVYKAPKAAIPHLLAFPPDELISFYAQIQGNQAIEFIRPERIITAEELGAEAEKVQTAFDKAADIWNEESGEIMEMLSRIYRNDWLNSSRRNYESRIKERDCTLPEGDTSLIRFTQSKVQSSLKKGAAAEHEFFRVFEEWYRLAEEFQDTARAFTQSIRYRLCLHMDEVLEKHKLKNDTQSYDDLITRMRTAVMENSGQGNMTRSLLRKYKAALIDEFQDTDPYQYDIFHTAFGRHEHTPFFMIGDPKQAIYSFRGADVFAYLHAAGEEGNKYTLTANHRSDPKLVEALNGFFTKERPFLLEQIDYSPSKGALKPQTLEIGGKAHPPVTVWQTDRVNQDAVAKSTARNIADLLNKAASGNASINGEKIKPSDIAVLCRTGNQLMKVKRALSACRVPAVVSGSESVFATEEALEMANMLSAVLNPYSRTHIKTALAMPVFGYKAEQIFGIEETELWDDVTAEFRRLNDLINIKGFAPMFFSLASERCMYSRIAGMPGGERKLTNMIHIAELAQKHEAEKKASPQDILKWMKERIASGDVRDDEAELKMDSDENAVTIVTIHKSKGLEYKIVYTPFLMFTTKEKTAKDKRVYKYHEGGRYLLDASPEAAEKAELEEKAEDLRIAYVALTRGKTACFTAWGNVDGHGDSAMSYIIGGGYEKYDPDKYDLFIRQNGILSVKLPPEDTQTYMGEMEKPGLSNRSFKGAVPAVWQINSFSRLVHSSSAVKDTDQFTAPQKAETVEKVFDIFTFPKGAKAGTCLHECMEETAFENCDTDSIEKIVYEKLGIYSFDPEYTKTVAENIHTIINRKMHGVRLKDLKAGDYAHEMEFQMAAESFSSAGISDIFRRHGEEDFAKAAGSLSFESALGYLNGFADLIFQQNGRYYVLDWKSNYLGGSREAYSHDRMHGEMLGSHYYLQLYIYALALHLHLKTRIKDYSYEKHFGCGLYIFMRGVNSDGDEGIYSHRPKYGIIEELENMVKLK